MVYMLVYMLVYVFMARLHMEFCRVEATEFICT